MKFPGSCGELAQGMIDGDYFHISCPINLFSYVSAELNDTALWFPSESWKAKKAMCETLKFLNKSAKSMKVRIESEIPTSKGMASSTADIGGVCLSVAKILKKEVSEEETSRIALSIEPTDGTLFAGIVLFDHRYGKIKEYIGHPPEMKILVVDLGVCIDTIQFNKNDFSEAYFSNRKKIEEAVKLIKNGIKRKDIRLIGKGATISAVCNQKILFKPELEKIIDISLKMGAVGVNAAHSGGVVGILLGCEFANIELLKNKIQEEFGKRFSFYETELIGGGGQIVARRKHQKSN